MGFFKQTLIYMFKSKQQDESELWDQKYKHSRTYDDKEDLFRFSKNNPTISTIESYIEDGVSILEIGSGTGELILYLQNKYPGCKMFGLDFSTESIVRSKNIARQFNIPVSFMQGDIKSMPFKDESFDIIFGDQVIGHMDNLDSALKEVYRVTKKEGIVAFSVANSLRPDGWYLSKILSRSHFGYKQKSMFSWMLSSRLNRSGLKKIKFYGDMLVLFRNFLLVKLLFLKKSRQINKVPEAKKIYISKNKSLLKNLYYYFDSIFPSWSKVTIGIVAKKLK